MHFLVDAQLPPSLARWLEAHGHEAAHVSEIGLLFASDRAIATRAHGLGAVIVTKDEDFLLTLKDGKGPPAVLWLRVGNASNPALLAWLERRWPNSEQALVRGERLVEVR